MLQKKETTKSMLTSTGIQNSKDDFFSQLYSNTRRMTGGHHVLEEVASCRRDTLDFVLSVRTLEALHRQHNTLVFLSRRRAAKIGERAG